LFGLLPGKAFDARTRSVRELYRQVHATRFKTANPKLQILTEVHNRADEPLAIFKFADGTESVFQSQHNIANEIIFQVHLKAQELDAQYEMSGKNIDDELSPWRDNS
jgi:hypothetical protein